MPLAANLLAATSDQALWLALLTGGGLAIVATAVGAVITQTFTVRIGREARRDERRLAVKSFQRDALVALQEAVVELFEATGPARFDLTPQAEGNESIDVESERAFNDAVLNLQHRCAARSHARFTDSR